MSNKIKTRKLLFGAWLAWQEPHPERHGCGRTEEEAIEDFKIMKKGFNTFTDMVPF
jgi:hypothetical protein